MKEEQPDEVKAQSTVLGFVAAEALKSIVGFIVLWFFKPVWERLVAWWTKDKKSS